MEKRLEFIDKLNGYLEVAYESYEKHRLVLNKVVSEEDYENIYDLAYESGHLDATRYHLNRIKELVNDYIVELTRKSLKGELDE